MSRQLRAVPLALLLLLPLACAYQVPVSQSQDTVELEITPREVILVGGTRASTRRFRVLWIGFGRRNSFLRAEGAAIDAVGADLLVSRIRLRHFEGFLIPSLWLEAFGLPATDVPIVGWEIYTVAGTGVRIASGSERASEGSSQRSPARNEEVAR